MCDCKKQILAKIRADQSTRLPAHDPKTLRVGFENQMIRFDGSENDVSVPVQVSYRKLKSDGTPHKSDKRDTLSMFMSHCPFCGQKYPEKEENAA